MMGLKGNAVHLAEVSASLDGAMLQPAGGLQSADRGGVKPTRGLKPAPRYKVNSIGLKGVFAVGLAFCAWAAPESPRISDFQKRIADYLKMRKSATSAVASLKTTDSPERLQEHELDLATAIQAARPAASQGDTFTPAIGAEFRRGGSTGGHHYPERCGGPDRWGGGEKNLDGGTDFRDRAPLSAA
jgi:hypothetical protein